jgi:hypothetical protein
MGGFRVTDHEATLVVASCNACKWRSSEAFPPKAMREAAEHANQYAGHIVTAVSSHVRIFKRVATHTDN